MEISIILNVSQNCSNQLIKVKLKNFKRESLQGNHLPVLSISVLFVSKVKIRRSMNCSLQSVDVVQRHITGNAYPGTSKLNFSFTSTNNSMALCYETELTSSLIMVAHLFSGLLLLKRTMRETLYKGLGMIYFLTGFLYIACKFV